MTKIFISYRRADSEGYVGRLYDQLTRHFDSSEIFLDVGTIKPGADFVTEIEKFVGGCEALIAVIGPQWVTACDKAGARRLDDPHDFVRLEIATALRNNALVIPVLVEGATMPSLAHLPLDLAGLARRNALELSHSRFEYDVNRLVAALGGAVGTLLVGLGSSFQAFQATGLLGAGQNFEVRVDRQRVGKITESGRSLSGPRKSQKNWQPLQVQIKEGVHTLQVIARRSDIDSGTHSNIIKFQVKGGQSLTFSIERQESQFGPEKIVLKSQNPINST
jgi:hypothetical protein